MSHNFSSPATTEAVNTGRGTLDNTLASFQEGRFFTEIPLMGVVSTLPTVSAIHLKFGIFNSAICTGACP